MKPIAKLFVIALMLLPAPLLAQSASEADLSQVMKDKKSIVKEMMQFNEKESAVFWPVYAEIEAMQLSYFSRYEDLLDDYMRERANLSDEKARAMTRTLLELQADQLKFKQAMVKKLSRKLSDKRVLQYLVIEEQFDAGFFALVAEALPPIK